MMLMLAVDWGYALTITLFGFGSVFILLLFLIGIIKVQSAVVSKLIGKGNAPAKSPQVAAEEETHPTPAERAAIAMAMHLYFNAHDEEAHVITIEEVGRRYSPWSSKIYNMNNKLK